MKFLIKYQNVLFSDGLPLSLAGSVVTPDPARSFEAACRWLTRNWPGTMQRVAVLYLGPTRAVVLKNEEEYIEYHTVLPPVSLAPQFQEYLDEATSFGYSQQVIYGQVGGDAGYWLYLSRQPNEPEDFF